MAEPFWAAVDEQRLVIQHCRNCGNYMHPPLPLCPACGNGQPDWREVSGRGTVANYTVVHRAPIAGFETPYVIALAELDDAPVRVLSNVIECTPDAVFIGLPVAVTYRLNSDGHYLFFFIPRSDLGTHR